MSIPYTYDPLGSLKGKNLTLDIYPTEGNFENAVSSGGVWFELNNHVTDFSLHFSETDRSDFEFMKNMFSGTQTHIDYPKQLGALDPARVARYISQYAEQMMPVAPGRVYVSRVPYARKLSDGTFINTASELNEQQYADQKKLMDNYGMKHVCSTDNPDTVGVDDYYGKWAFFWQRCNYIRDEYGVKWVSAIEGAPISDGERTYVFDETKPTGVFGPPIWTFCKTDKSILVEGDDGVNPNYQLWGIGDRPWNQDTDLGLFGLTDQKKAQLEALGITEDDYHLWSTAKYFDGEHWKSRPYIIDSAYCGTAVVNSSGTLVGFSSIINEPILGGQSYNSLNTLRQRDTPLNTPIGDGGARACALGIMFDIVKNATKDSQAIHRGMDNNNGSGVQCCVGADATPFANLRTKTASNIFPIKSNNTEFEPGLTVYIRATKPSAQTSPNYTRNHVSQIGRIIAIENREVEFVDYSDEPTTVTKTLKCLVLDPTTVENFYVCCAAKEDGTADEAAATAYANDLVAQDPNAYAVAFVSRGPAMSGETYVGVGQYGTGVVGKHDGSVYSLSNGKHPYRVQGMEMMGGILQTAVDVVCIKGDGTIIDLPEGDYTTTANDYVYLYSPPNVLHRSSGTISQFIDNGYVAVGVSPYTGNAYIYNGAVDTKWGVWYPTLLGSSSSYGHKDYIWTNNSTPTAYRSGGFLYSSGLSGSAGLLLHSGLGVSYWYFGSRD